MNHLPGYFQKVENFIDLDSDILKNLELSNLIDKYVAPTVVLEYYEFKDLKKVRSILKRKFCKIDPTYVLYSQITGEGLLGAHIDHGPLVCLNFYMTANEDKTIFFKKKNDTVSGEIYPGKEDANVFDIKDLDYVGEFVANNNESYLLNVSKIHCVHKVNDSKRTFINFAWCDHTYEEVLDNLI